MTPPISDQTDHVFPQVSGPLQETERIASIDVLRGVALLGIPVLNIQSYAMPSAAYINPTAYGDLTGINYWVWYFSQLLGEQKFMTIFSMLFGAGIVVMSSRLQARGARPTGVHYRRMLWLLLFGLLHGYLFWYGDILYSYALCGMIVYSARRLPPWLLITLGVFILGVGSAISLFEGWSMRFWGEEGIAGFRDNAWKPTAEVLQHEIDAYQGSLAEQFRQRAPETLMFQTMLFLTWTLWRAGGLMLLGMGLFRLGVFSGQRSTTFYLALMAIGAFVGLPMVGYGLRLNEQLDWPVDFSFFTGSQFNYWGSLLVSLGYVGIVMLICKLPLSAMVTRPFAAVGQMALTNYLLHTIICTTIFYGFGFGLFGQVERWGQILIVASIWVVQLIVSPIWLKQFRFGPMEWLWRTLTYWKPQPMRRFDSSPAPIGL